MCTGPFSHSTEKLPFPQPAVGNGGWHYIVEVKVEHLHLWQGPFHLVLQLCHCNVQGEPEQ